MGRLTCLTAAVFATLALSSASLACAEGDGGNPPERAATGKVSVGGPDAAGASAGHGKLRATRVGFFNEPVEIRHAPGFPNLMFVVEQPGRIMVIRRGRKLARPFLDINRLVSNDGGERGLLSVAFPPDYRKSKRFYVYYVDNAGNIRVAEFRRRTAVRARRHSGRTVIRIAHPVNSNHNGGRLGFLGHDLYFGTGDGGGAGDEPGNAQNLNSLLGKLIRIDPRRSGKRPYTVPASNPFVGRRGRDEIFAYGLRNPFRWSFDRTSSKRNVRIAIGDVGQDAFEEVNYLNLGRARGGNFGWNRWEGYTPFNGGGAGTIKPSLVLPHPPNCSVIGGLVVRDRRLPALRGRYVFTDFCSGKILSFKPHLGRAAGRPTGLNIGQVTSFGDSLGGALFVTSLNGSVYRIRQ
ncbi:MAG TPA: PQQ-dependent sugar dehydrogenase [Solirubrobacterales bacterium]|nr:PQQ-dependent sugar dehydrogenase [Solirubrobacterales bacterium]